MNLLSVGACMAVQLSSELSSCWQKRKAIKGRKQKGEDRRYLCAIFQAVHPCLVLMISSLLTDKEANHFGVIRQLNIQHELPTVSSIKPTE
ncbi:hypothetical protein VNO77_20586 [Canavalia gladiata]|uniref:Uncharacterized protein n=1 Tax=Canavalia gladiata TaxID=3824 RepID=A0AAN9LPI3_CANGL